MTRAGKSPGVVGKTTTGAEVHMGSKIQYISSEPPLQALHLDGGARPCGPHAHEDRRANHADKPKNQRRSARSLPAVSRYRPGSDYRPPEKALARRQGEVLDLLSECGSRGVTRLEAPRHLSLSLSQRIFELRQKGYRIDSVLEHADEGGFARYVLVAPEPVSEGEATP